jgi:hypothetical protein
MCIPQRTVVKPITPTLRLSTLLYPIGDSVIYMDTPDSGVRGRRITSLISAHQIHSNSISKNPDSDHARHCTHTGSPHISRHMLKNLNRIISWVKSYAGPNFTAPYQQPAEPVSYGFIIGQSSRQAHVVLVD